MTEFIFDPLAADDEFTQRRRHFEQRAQQLREQGIRPGETRPELPTYSDRELALQLLTRERGLSELEAFRTLERDPNVLTELAPEIERARDFRARTDSERVERERAATPEAKALAAAEALDRQAHDARRVEAGRALIAADPEGHGVAAAMIADLTPAEVLAVSGLVQADDPAHSIEANLGAAEGGEAA